MYALSSVHFLTFEYSFCGQRAHVHFTAFNLEASSSCAYDVLDVFDGADDSARTLGRFCGNDAPSDITATANSMLVCIIMLTDA